MKDLRIDNPLEQLVLDSLIVTLITNFMRMFRILFPSLLITCLEDSVPLPKKSKYNKHSDGECHM